ncbi:MAG TPA: glycosyltransferase [Bryobacteraceae bacterium]|nr:glycosyltransferase [Bryobacteraceae bacterium]
MTSHILRFLLNLPLLLVSPLLVLVPALTLAICDLFWFITGRRHVPADTRPDTSAASVVIPNWNGRDLLEKYLPSVVQALTGNPRNEVIVVDNGSTDGSADWLRQTWPQVRLLALPENLGFGGGSNAGFRAAANDIVVLLNSDMRVDAGFLQPLLDGFTDEKVFAVACQIFFSDPKKLREETGLTQAWWSGGQLRVRHRDDAGIRDLYPCFYPGGGSSAFDRRKFLELGGFDHLLRPFYLEDTDLGLLAWKRGWKVLYQPRSIVFHEHRGTIGKKFSHDYIQTVLEKNFALFTWKSIHSWRMLVPHFGWSWADAALSTVFGHSPERATLRGLFRACLQLVDVLRARCRSRALSVIDDEEAFRRPLGGYFRDRFQKLTADPERLGVLFVSPYPICPPVHGGGVFMYQTANVLADLVDLHLIILLDRESERPPHDELAARCASAEFIVRMTGAPHSFGSIVPHAVREFANRDLEWLIHRQIYTKNIDVLQLEYMPLGQYSAKFRQMLSILFEHDVYFQSVGRQLATTTGALKRVQTTIEYLRGMRYELNLLPHVDRVQVCSDENAAFLLRFLPNLKDRIDSNFRAGIDTSRYSFQVNGRRPGTMLFLGSFRHLPNQEALSWFVREVLPLVLKDVPEATLVVVGSDPPPRHSLPDLGQAIELRGFVPDAREPLAECAVFVCPILSGSGMRVKLLEAFAAGIPVVSTTVGAEGLASEDGKFCALADDPRVFARRTIALLRGETDGSAMALRARQHVEHTRDMRAITRAMVEQFQNDIQLRRREG